jgi:hypothetical protein
MNLTEQHMFVCHSDGSTCEDGCDVAPLPGKLEELEAILDPYPDARKPPPGSWADVARMMAAISSDDDGIDWDAWKDEMKETNGQGY